MAIEAVVLAAATATGNLLAAMDAAFWQKFLAAELSPSKAAKAVEEARKRPLGVAESRAIYRYLSESETARAENCDLPLLEKMLAQGVGVLELSEFPIHVQQAASAPQAVFFWGNRDAVLKPSVAIVGTRGASPYGKAVAIKFAEAFARAGLAVLSGGALGIDAAALQGALDAKGQAVAVLGTGIERVYPRSHAGLFRRIRENGALVSPFAVGVKPRPDHFLARNRVVAALSQAVLVVEAPERSGALSTANAAAELNRPVFVVPANVDKITFRGSHELIRQGAILVDHPDQVLEDLRIEPVRAAKPEAHNEVSSRILQALTTDPKSTEKIAEQTGLEITEVLVELTSLEMAGLVMSEAGGFIRAL